MAFPLTVGSRIIDGPTTLAGLVLDDARVGGGAVIAGKRPDQWVFELVERGHLARDMAVSLAAMLMQARSGGPVAVGARLAARLRHPALDDMIGKVLAGTDTGVLLEPDPANPGRSTEDALLAAWTEVAPLGEDDVRAELLERLRNAGLPNLEVQVLAIWGTADEIRRWLPAVFTEGVPEGAVGAVTIGQLRGPDVQKALADALAAAPEAVRARFDE